MPTRAKSRKKLVRTTYIKGDDLSVQAVAPISESDNEVLKELCQRCRREQGRYLDRSQIIRSLIRALIGLKDEVDWSGVMNEQDLRERLVRAFSQKKK